MTSESQTSEITTDIAGGDHLQGVRIGPTSPAEEWDRDSASRALDELFNLARRYTSSAAYRELLQFVTKFPSYAPFNAMLIHMQLPGASFVAPPRTWFQKYGRRVNVGSRPIVILRPMGPVMFVFDVSNTEPIQDNRPLPRLVERPFEVKKGRVGGELLQTKANAARDGVQLIEHEAGSQQAGQIALTKAGRFLKLLVRKQPDEKHLLVPLRYELLLNCRLSPEAKYVTVCHELGHLYCGHLGTPNKKWWPDRRGLPTAVCEFEAESVCYLVCCRLGIDNPSDEYLAGYIREKAETPPISLDCVLKAAGLIEQMGRTRLKPREQARS